VEEHFYLGLPWIIRFASRRAVLWVSLGICIAEPLFRSYALIAGFEAPYYTWFRLDGLAWGVIVAYLVRNHPPERVKKYGWLFCSTAILMVAVSAPFGGASHLKPVGVATLYACAALFVAGLVSGAAAGPGNRWFAVLRSRVLKFFGDISYCLYLVHILIILGFYRVATAMFHRPYLGGMFHNTALAYAVHFVIVFAVCTLIGVLSRDYFEGPIRSYRVNYQ
jgi:peptidoglycan/LPS O-acetylase OafA/YrhL